MPDNLDPTRVISVKGVHRLRRESGVTILMVAVGMFALLSMAILALDVVNVYMSSTQAQKAADAAALAGAEALASSGTTSNPSRFPLNSVCNGSNGDADSRAQAVAAQNMIAGLPPTTVTTACPSTAPPSNPQIQVAVTRTGIPTFLAQMWGHTSSTVSATALAEAYNPQPNNPPIAIHGVKPWLIADCNPTPTTLCTGGPLLANAASFIGQPITLTLMPWDGPPSSSLPNAQFYALDGPAPVSCPPTSAVSCSQIGTGNPNLNYHDNIACENGFNFSNGQFVGPGQVFHVDTRFATGTGNPQVQLETTAGTDCLIHASNAGTGQGQDIFTPPVPPAPVTITGGSNNPNASLRSVNGIHRSDSVVTVPVFDCPTTAGICPGAAQLQIAGFLQLGIQDINSPCSTPNLPCVIDAVLLNVAVIDPASTGTPITGAGTSPVPVRLIH